MKTIKLIRESAGFYKYADGDYQFNIWRFQSAYGDIQWGCDVAFEGIPVDYWQADMLSQIRKYIENFQQKEAP